jgi:hypothetical protein
MGTLYIIGAGCSRNYDQSETRVQGLLPPLNSDFFAMAKKIVDQNPRVLGYGMMGLHHLIRDLNRVYGYGDSDDDTTVLGDPRLTLEGVMMFYSLRHQLLDRNPFFDRDNRSSTLNDLIALTLAESLKGPLCPKHAKLASLMQPGDMVFNFNYDILMDNALYQSGRLTDSGYRMRFDYTHSDGEWAETRHKDSDVSLLKLHGSLNWLRCTTCGRNLLLRGAKTVQQQWEDIRAIPVSCPRCKDEGRLNLRRVLIPPTGIKNYSDPDIRYLWMEAAAPASEIGGVVAIGYQFADLDHEVEMLLRTLVVSEAMRRDVPVSIVNKSPEHAQGRLQSIFPKSEMKVWRSLDSFLGGEPSAP